MKPDYDRFLPLLETMDLSYEGKKDLLDALWVVMTGIVELAFDEQVSVEQTATSEEITGLGSNAGL